MEEQLNLDTRTSAWARGGPVGPDRLLVAQEVATMLLVPPAWVYAETRAGRPPHVPSA